MMVEKFIERGTDYPLEHGVLSVYETNCACRDVQFYFEQNVLTIMVSGHKTVVSDKLKCEFFPGTLFIPERRVIQKVAIPNASIYNPTKCLVLTVEPTFLHQFYEEIFYAEKDKLVLKEKTNTAEQGHFFSNDKKIIENFIRLYKHRKQEETRANEMICTFALKELLLRVFQTDGLSLLIENFEDKIENRDIRKSITFLKSNLDQKITVEQLAQHAGLGLTTFFKKFKENTHLSPADYILRERIRQSKVLMLRNQLSLKEIAYRCGFNSYEYFCNSFKKIEKQKPTEFKRSEVSSL
ncbi:MAG: AraC family transcriptional regulator [Bacteroidota bacterium]